MVSLITDAMDFEIAANNSCQKRSVEGFWFVKYVGQDLSKNQVAYIICKSVQLLVLVGQNQVAVDLGLLHGKNKVHRVVHHYNKVPYNQWLDIGELCSTGN